MRGVSHICEIASHAGNCVIVSGLIRAVRALVSTLAGLIVWQGVHGRVESAPAGLVVLPGMEWAVFAGRAGH